MAAEVSCCIEEALAKFVSFTDESGNLRKDLKTVILEVVSNLRKSFKEVKTKLEVKDRENKHWKAML